jgi:hypothetical protein
MIRPQKPAPWPAPRKPPLLSLTERGTASGRSEITSQATPRGRNRGSSVEQVGQLLSELRENQSAGCYDKATLQIGHNIKLSGFSFIAQFHKDALCIVQIPNMVGHAARSLIAYPTKRNARRSGAPKLGVA